MHTMKLTRYTKLSVLKRTGPGLSSGFLARFKGDFNLLGLPLPPPDLPEDQYYVAVMRLLSHPDKLPDRLNEALFAMETLSGPECRGVLEDLPEWQKLSARFTANSTYEEVALQVWLRDERLLVDTSTRQHLKRLTAFEHAARSPKFPEPLAPFHIELPASFSGPGLQVLPAPPLLQALTNALDKWFLANDRGEETTKLEVYVM